MRDCRIAGIVLAHQPGLAAHNITRFSDIAAGVVNPVGGVQEIAVVLS